MREKSDTGYEMLWLALQLELTTLIGAGVTFAFALPELGHRPEDWARPLGFVVSFFWVAMIYLRVRATQRDRARLRNHVSTL